MPKIVSRHHKKIEKVPSHDKHKALLPSFQATASIGQLEFQVVPISPVAPTNTFTNGTTLLYNLQHQQTKEISHLVVRMKISATSDTQLVPTMYMFNVIELIGSHGSGEYLSRIYPETILAYDFLTNDENGQEKWSEMANYSLSELRSRNLKKFYTGENNYIRAGTTKELYIQIPLSFIRFGAIDMGHIADDLQIRFDASNDVVISGSSSNISLNAFDLLIATHKDHTDDRHSKLSVQKKSNHSYIWCEPERLQVNTKTLTAGATTDFVLDQFSGKVPFLMVVIKGSTTPSASDKTKFDFYEIGKFGTFDILSSTGESLLCGGTPINQIDLYNWIQDQVGFKPWAGVYIIPFCENIKQSVAGIVNSFRQFYGQNDKLSITFDSAPTQEIQTVSIGTTASSGTYRYAWENGYIADSEVDYDDLTADLLVSINEMPQLGLKGISATSVGANLEDDDEHVITFSARSGAVEEELGKITLLGNGIPKVSSTAITTRGVDGWTSGSGYQVEIFAFKFWQLIVDKDGKLKREML